MSSTVIKMLSDKLSHFPKNVLHTFVSDDEEHRRSLKIFGRCKGIIVSLLVAIFFEMLIIEGRRHFVLGVPDTRYYVEEFELIFPLKNVYREYVTHVGHDIVIKKIQGNRNETVDNM